MERKYKESGIEWIGKIPEAWEVKRLKNLCTSNGSMIADGDWIESPDISDEGIRYYTTGNIGDGVFKNQGDGFISESTFNKLNCTAVYPGDLVFSRLNNPIGRACIIPNNYPICIVAVDNVIVRPDSKYDKRFLVYISMCPGYQETNMLIARGTTMQRMSRSQLQNVEMPIPPLANQQRIADYLDKKCGEINSLIALQEQMIEKLKAYKQSVITEAVTKGLNPNAKLVPSGIDWIGDIPEGWKVTRMKFLGTFQNGLTYTPYDVCGSEGVLVLRSSNIQESKLDFKDNVYVAHAPEDLMVEKGDIIICSRNGSASLVGKCALVEEDISNCSFGAFMVRFRSNLVQKFSYYLVSTVIPQYKQLFTTTTINQLTKGMLSSMVGVLPSVSEQQDIASYLDDKCSEIDRLIDVKQQKIEKLKDYKKSVIYEAVTGKTIIE